MKPHAATFLATFVIAASLGFGLQPLSVQADGERASGSQARALRERGRILPMEDILARSRGIQPGQVVEVELEHEDGRYVYEVKIIDDGNRVHKLELDAASGALLRHKSR